MRGGPPTRRREGRAGGPRLSFNGPVSHKILNGNGASVTRTPLERLLGLVLLVRVWLYAFIAHLVRDLVIQLGPHGATLLIVHHLLCFIGIAVFMMTPCGGMLIALGPLVTEMGSGLLNLWAVDLALRGMNAPCWPKGDAVPWLAPALYGSLLDNPF